MKKRQKIEPLRGKRVGPDVTAVYDFKRSPTTFDFAQFLLAARMYAGADGSLRVMFIPTEKTEDGFKAGKFPAEQKSWRLWNVLIPLCRLANARPAVCHGRREAARLLQICKAIWPEHYEIKETVADYRLSAPLKLHKRGYPFVPFQASEEAKRYVAQYLASLDHDGRFVSITIRNSRNPHRNSDQDEWRLVMSHLYDLGYGVIVVPDLEDAFADHRPHYFSMAALSVDIRMALYQACAMNLGVNNGPMALCYFSEAPYLTFKMVSQGTAATRPEHFDYIGFPIGSQMPWAGPRQRIVWEADKAATIMREFARAMGA